jgi:hypothetical protein
MLHPVEPIDTLALFPRLHTELVQLLRQLPSAGCLKPTPATGWSVKDMDGTTLALVITGEGGGNWALQQNP